MLGGVVGGQRVFFSASHTQLWLMRRARCGAVQSVPRVALRPYPPSTVSYAPSTAGVTTSPALQCELYPPSTAGVATRPAHPLRRAGGEVGQHKGEGAHKEARQLVDDGDLLEDHACTAQRSIARG